jgi:S-(hydroxymethyl)glutathione dehydrogenase / alcohol dehydrogenase
VCRGAGEPLAIEEIVVDPPKAYELRIRIICTSLCHSDVTFWGMKVCVFVLITAARSLVLTSHM